MKAIGYYEIQTFPRRIPWGRELFFIFLAFGGHPIRWSEGEFKPTGLLFSILRSSVALGVIVAGVINYIVPDWTLSRKPQKNPIYRELETFAMVVSMTSDILIAMLIFGLNHRRKLIARVFNELQHLWLSLDCPRQLIPGISLISAGMALTSCLISVGESVYDFVTLDYSGVGMFTLISYPVYNGLLDFFPIMVISLIIAVYGAVADMFNYFPQAHQAYGIAAWKRSDLQEIVDTLDDILTTFSAAMSPLIAILMPACSSALMILLFETVVRDFEDSDADLLYVVTVIMYFIWLSVALALSYIVETQLNHLRYFMGCKILDYAQDYNLQKAKRTLYRISHPPTALKMFRFHPYIVIGFVVFFVNYFFVLIQLRAVVIGNCSGGSPNSKAG